VLNGKSAYKGKQDQTVNDALDDIACGLIDVLVIWAADRIERRGAYNAFDLARRVKEAGKLAGTNARIEYVKDDYLNTANDMSDVMLALAATQAHQESKRKSQRTKAKQSRLRAEGSVIGRPPWGMRIEQRGGVKVLVPTADGRKYIPLIYQAAIDGKSARDIAARKRPHIERYFVPGDTRSDAIARLRERGAEAMRTGDYQAATDAMAEASKLEALPRTKPHWEGRETDQSEAAYYAGLSDDQRREYLANFDVRTKLQGDRLFVDVMERP
jgi:DNA invertase Pin-like site-specific DNA recombinase